MSVSTGGLFWRKISGSAAHFYRQQKHRQVFQFISLFPLLRSHIAEALAFGSLTVWAFRAFCDRSDTVKNTVTCFRLEPILGERLRDTFY